jgi:MYXO-CTERM domain-containing protein
MQMAADCQTGAKSGATGAPLLLILFALLFFWLFFCCFSG